MMCEPRPYHHGDLRRALIGAARQLLEEVGADDLSLRAVAREAGVSPAAPYHHFKDKGDLLAAVAEQGFEMLAEDISLAVAASTPGSERMVSIGSAYVMFAHHNRALYRIMAGSARTRDRPAGEAETRVAEMILAGVATTRPGVPEDDLALACAGVWATMHGLADMMTFKVMEPFKIQFDSEQAFVRAVLTRLGAEPTR